MTQTRIRETRVADHDVLPALYTAAFPEEDLLTVLHDLLNHGAGILSLAAEIDSAVVGHTVFADCTVDGAPAALLGPVAVSPDQQRRGVGSAMVTHGLGMLQKQGTRDVLVLGDPAYYGRFGFAPSRVVQAPYALPAEWADAWQVLTLNGPPLASGTLMVPAPWRNPVYWGP